MTRGRDRISVAAEGGFAMRRLMLIAAIFAAGSASAQEVRRLGPQGGPISSSVELPQSSRVVYVSGTVPDPADPRAPAGSVQRYGDTEAQTRSVLRKIAAQLRMHGFSMREVVMMRVFLVAPPGSEQMDFAGMMRAYGEFFGTEVQPMRPARSTMQVAGWSIRAGWSRSK
jgi:enamine deaminase RidA (YjgF/YER057c/UK114 family)